MTFDIFGIVPGNSALCIKYQIYGIGNNPFHPNNSVDELLYSGENLVNERTGKDWGWDNGDEDEDNEDEQDYKLINPLGTEGDGIKFYGSLEDAIALAKSLPDDPNQRGHRKEEWEEYIRSIASSSEELLRRKDVLDYSRESGLYSFRFAASGIRMTIETSRVIAYVGYRPKMFYHSFKW